MFSRAPRFPPEKPSDVPGPNYYKLPEQENWDSYKRGAFLDKAERFPKDKVSEVPDDSPPISEQPDPASGSSGTGRRADSVPNIASLRQQIEALKTQNAKLERVHELDSKRFQEQATKDKQRIEALAKQASHLEGQVAASQKSNADLKREYDRAVERERRATTKLERLEAGNKEGNERLAKYNALRKELDELQKLHEDEKKTHRAEVQQLKTALDQNRKASVDQQNALKKQLDTAESKAQECKKSLLAAQSEVNALKVKLRGQERDKAISTELDRVRKALDNAESNKRERESKIMELERTLRLESKKRTIVEEQIRELKGLQGKLSNIEGERSELAKQLEEALEVISTLHGDSEAELLAAREEVNDLKTLVEGMARMYGSLFSSTVSKTQLEEEKMRFMDAQRRLIKTERRLLDKEAQVQELVVYLRYKGEQQDLLARSLADAEEEIAFLRSLHASSSNEPLQQDILLSSIEEELQQNAALCESELEYTRTLQEFGQEWLDILLRECKAADNVATSLGAALNLVLERTAELNGQLQVTQIESEAARKRARETDEEVGLVKAEFERQQGEKERLSEEAHRQIQQLSKELADVRRKFEEAKRRGEKAEISLREKTAAEKALADDIEGLSEALRDAMRWEDAYKRLHEEVEALVQRNELVEREAENMSRFNAEILGHTNPNQKIHYLDRIRRDLAETKQKLAVSTRQREAVLEDNDTLRTELHAYRSLSESRSKGPGMTRVSRLPFSMSSTNGPPSGDSGRDPLSQVPEDQTMALSRRDQMTLDELM